MTNSDNSFRFAWLPTFSAVVVIAVGLAVFSAYRSNARFAIFFMWYSSVGAAVIISGARYFQCQRVLAQVNRRAHKRLLRRREQIAKLLRRKIRPRIDFCGDLDDVCRKSRELISDAHSQRTDEYRYVTFYGAAHLSVPDSESEEYGTVGGSGEVSPYQQYLGALEAATGDKVRMKRYIKLFSCREFKKRSAGVQREYVNWLKGQHNMLSRNPNYVLVNVVRAPKWGSGIARIITHRAIMEITGNGEGAVVITDNHLGETIRRAAKDSVVGGRETKNKPVYYGNQTSYKTTDEFKKYYSDLEKLISLRTVRDEQARG
jgi:hypothetical protein